MSSTDNRSPYDTVITLLSRREYSRQELCLRLEKDGISSADIEVVLTKLVEEGLQSDRRYALMIVRHRANMGYGPIYVRAFLRQRGVASTEIAQAIAESSVNWQHALQQAWLKRFNHVPQNLIENQRQCSYFQRRGFHRGMIDIFMKQIHEDGIVDA